MILITTPTKDDTGGIQEVFYRTWLTAYPNEEAGVTINDIEEYLKGAFTPETLAKRSAQFEHPPENSLLLIAKDGEKVVGVCNLFKREGYDQLQAIYILPEYQRQGIGIMFWKKAEEFFGMKKDIIVQVATYNEQAIAFYKKLGFHDAGKRFTEERHRMKSGALIPEMEMILPSSTNTPAP